MASRPIWFALFSLAAVGGLGMVRAILGSQVADQTLRAAVAATDASDTALPLPKGDRLPSSFIDGAPREIPVVTVKVAPTENPQKLEATNNEIVSWHWHQGSKIVRRRRTP
jgi:hypothetical protein